MDHYEKSVKKWLGRYVKHISDSDDDRPGIVTGVEFTLDGGFVCHVSWGRDQTSQVFAYELVIKSTPAPY